MRFSGYREVKDRNREEVMSPFERALLHVAERDAETVEIRTSTHAYAMLEELRFVWREAQLEADEAYEDWNAVSSRDRYAVYRAAQDRADAAQDDLAELVAHLPA